MFGENPAPAAVHFIEVPEADPPIQAVFANRGERIEVFYNLDALLYQYIEFLSDAFFDAQASGDRDAMMQVEGARQVLMGIAKSNEILALDASMSL